MEFKKCSMCVEGVLLNTSTRRVEACKVCHGTGVTTPNDICHCGRSCVMEKDGHSYCGDEACFRAAERDARWYSSSYYDDDFRPRHF